jgi:ABC-type proline/glycine betaine transport system ATPase subunit
MMDEPFGAVDPIVRAALQDELVKLQGGHWARPAGLGAG